MAAAGTIVLAKSNPMVEPDCLNHQFTTLGGGQFETNLCITPVPFTIHSNEVHILLTDFDEIVGASVGFDHDHRGPLSINGSFQLGFSVHLNMPDMMLHIGQDTSLSLLLRSGCLKMTPFLLTKQQVTQLIPPNHLKRKKSG